MSTFHGLEMAKQALFTQQSALYTTGHNISNANTKGYSRQRVNFEALDGFPPASLNRPGIPGQVGTGVKAGTIERIRNKFLDTQYRAENSKAGFWETRANALSRMENLMNETTEHGLSKSMDSFWQSLQDLAVNPGNSGARSVVVERGKALAETFNYMSKSLNSIRTDLETQMEATVTDTNSILTQINEINKQIKQIEPHGYLANDLYDDRDRLIDELSNIVNIKVNYHKSADSSPDIAQGLASIELVNDDGKSYDPPMVIVNGNPEDTSFEIKEFTLNQGDPATITIDGNQLPLDGVEKTGSMNALIDAYSVEYVDMLDQLNQMAGAFVEAFNAVHESGRDLNGEQGIPFFTGSTAGDIAVSQELENNPDLIAAAAENQESGNGDNASLLAAVFDDKSVNLGGNKSIKGFYESLIGKLGVKAKEANRMVSNTGILVSQVENERMSVSSVSLDEEMTNMIKFQHAYNAAARSMTAIDEMLDRIINSMGLVGR